MIGCGEVFDVVEISINDEIKIDHTNTNTIRMVKDVLKKNKVTDFILCYMSKNMKHFANSGAEVGDKFTGTLGAFVEAEQDTSSSSISQHEPKSNWFALISNHLARFQPGNRLLYEGNLIADILDPSLVKGADIAAAQIHKDYRKMCKQVFKTQGGKEVPCLLLSNFEDLKTSSGENVHIWGAKSKPGIGKIISCKYELSIDNARGYHIIISDRHTDSRFSQPGDSGSVICKTSKDGKTLYAIGMLVGELISHYTDQGVNERRYSAFEFQFGLERLTEAYGFRIKWLPTK